MTDIGEDETIAGAPLPRVSLPPGALVGRVLGGRYHVLSFLGAGGMGEVYRARDRELDEVVALKFIRAELAASPDLLRQFRQEVRLARRVAHPSVARVYELHDLEGSRFLTMEFVDGESLATLLTRESQLPVALCARIGVSVAQALEAAHRVGVIHRDIKPDNLMLRRDERVVVTDFGIAFASDERQEETLGTPAYMAPEQLRGEPAAPAADLYSLGVTLFELATGSLPFAGTPTESMLARLSEAPPNPRARRSDLPEGFAEVIRRMMATSLSDRFASAEDLAVALSDWCGSEAPTVAVRPAEFQDGAPTVRLDVAGTSQLAAALREETRLSLAQAEGVRIVFSPGDATFRARVSFPSEGTLALQVLRGGATVYTGELPFGPDQLHRVAALLAESVALAAGSERAEARMPPWEPGTAEIWLDARRAFRSTDSAAYGDSVARYDDALTRSPNHPVLVSGRAMATLRHAFFGEGTSYDFGDVRRDVRQALAAAPHRPEPHLAAGHLALHLSDPVDAARSFRAALRVAPLWPDGHEWLGRMLLEAGVLNEGRARLEAAMKRNAELTSLRWEIARAAALEGHWDEVDTLLAGTALGARLIGRLRLASYRGDEAWRESLASELETRDARDIFDRILASAVLCAARGDWPSAREVMVERASATRYASRRRTVFYAQLACEFAALHGDREVALSCLERAVEGGLFDAHWLGRSPHLQVLRETPRFLACEEQVARRASQVHDALYGT
ncbi:MAG: protein kinase [Myxococcota bacterium]